MIKSSTILNMKIPATLKRYADMIDSIDDERAVQNGYWVNLRNGYIDAESGCHAIHEDTLVACASRLRWYVKPCQCEDCSRERP